MDGAGVAPLPGAAGGPQRTSPVPSWAHPRYDIHGEDAPDRVTVYSPILAASSQILVWNQSWSSKMQPLKFRGYPQIASLSTSVTVICPIVVSALAPCQCRSPALICTTSPTLISRCSCSVATIPEPEVTISN